MNATAAVITPTPSPAPAKQGLGLPVVHGLHTNKALLVASIA